MARFNSDFWEIPTDLAVLDRFSATSGLYYETRDDQARRHVMRDFFQMVGPTVLKLIDSHLTRRQREVVKLYYYHDKTQEDIAAILDLTQSTVSRHLFGTVRAGKKVGGAIPKLRRAINNGESPTINTALSGLQKQMRQPIRG